MTNSKLNGVEMWFPALRPTTTTPMKLHLRQGAIASIEVATALGAKVVMAEESDFQLPDNALLLFPRSDPAERRYDRLERSFAVQHPDDFVVSEPLHSVNRDTLSRRLPVVIAMSNCDRGHCKYLIETETQLQKLFAFIDESPQERYEQHFQVRNYVDTGKTASSYRVLVTSRGAALMLGITGRYRTSRPVTMDRFDDVLLNQVSLQVKRALEDPNSRYYLAASDIRSNVVGAETRCSVTLLGGLCRPPSRTPTQERFLLDNHIESMTASILGRVLRVACEMGRTIGPRLDLICAVDVLHDKQTDRVRACELNYTPIVGSAFAPQGRGSFEAVAAARIAALETMARGQERALIQGPFGGFGVDNWNRGVISRCVALSV